MINWRGIKQGTRCALANEKYSPNHNFVAICLNISRMLDGNEIEKAVRYETLDEWNGTWNVMKRGYWKPAYRGVNISRGYSFDAVNLRPQHWASSRSCGDARNASSGNCCGSKRLRRQHRTLSHIALEMTISPREKHINRVGYGFILPRKCTSRFSLIFCFCALHNTMKINNAHRQRKNRSLSTSSTKKWTEKFPIKMLRSASSHYLALHIQFSITISAYARLCRVDAFIWQNICVGVDSPSGIWKHERKVFVWKWKTNQDHVCGQILIELPVRFADIRRSTQMTEHKTIALN